MSPFFVEYVSGFSEGLAAVRPGKLVGGCTEKCMVRRATAREKRGREDKSAQMYSAFSGDQLSWP
jgi:hypothetical protein